ncbi:hypothetical protein [Kiloniella majae]|uniref:hypothetical protein n=1 Tax=Kiloniella majae TaxID=1938558 RepID=UPI000A278898|nr:hypothetical protein [Kiloniella majae]
MNNETTSKDDGANLHYLRVEDIIAEGHIPVDVVTDTLFNSPEKTEVMLQSNFDPIPLRMKLTKMGCIIDRKDTPEGWLFHIYRDQTLIKKEKTKDTAKAVFSFDDDIITIDVRPFNHPNDFLEVLRFMDTSLDSDCFGVKIRRLSNKFRDILSERRWICISDTKVNDSNEDDIDEYRVMILEKE